MPERVADISKRASRSAARAVSLELWCVRPSEGKSIGHKTADQERSRSLADSPYGKRSVGGVDRGKGQGLQLQIECSGFAIVCRRADDTGCGGPCADAQCPRRAANR